MERKDLICVSMTTWEGDYMKTIVHMMSQLAKNHRVLFVDYAFTWKDVLFTLLGRGKAPIKRMLGLEPRLRVLDTREGDQIFHLTLPPVLPINWIKSSTWFSRMLRIQSKPVIAVLKSTLKKLGFDSPTMINAFHPVMGVALANQLNVSHTVYYCYDEIRAAHWAGIHGGRFEEAFIPITDGVIVTSEGLYNRRKAVHENVKLIKNGVDFELFNSAFNPNKNNERPVVGYLGSIDDRLDFDLLEQVIRSSPQLDFHFVGRITYPAAKSRLERNSNTKFFGAQAPDDIPRYLSTFDVGLIPFKKNEFTKNIYPLKINEYLAADIPVVATAFADLSDFTGYISLADTKEIFMEAIYRGITGQSLGSDRIKVARSNGWESRALIMEEFLGQLTLNEPVHA